MDKRPPCCARLVGKVTSAKADLKTYAIRAATADQKGQPMGRWKLRIAHQQVVIEQAEQALIDHEAEHAAD